MSPRGAPPHPATWPPSHRRGSGHDAGSGSSSSSRCSPRSRSWRRRLVAGDPGRAPRARQPATSAQPRAAAADRSHGQPGRSGLGVDDALARLDPVRSPPGGGVDHPARRPRGSVPRVSPPASRRPAKGALAQLIAIDRAALESTVGSAGPRGDRPVGRCPAAPTPVLDRVARPEPVLLSAADQPATGTTTPAAARRRRRWAFSPGRPTHPTSAPQDASGLDVKTPCVDLVLTLTTAGGLRAGRRRRLPAHDLACAAAGSSRPEPEPAPSLWPGTQAAIDAGYRWLEVPRDDAARTDHAAAAVCR